MLFLPMNLPRHGSGLSVKEYKSHKGLKKESLRDNMTDILNMLAEATTTTLSGQEHPETFEESRDIAKRGGKVANTAKIVFLLVMIDTWC